MKRIIACVQYLEEHNDAFRGTGSTVYTKNNGKFLGLIEIISKFDALMVEHLRRTSRKEKIDNYLGWKIQNELIDLISKKIKEEIKSRVKKKQIFFSAIRLYSGQQSHRTVYIYHMKHGDL
jgi:alanine-alpha-ketoisovalerate/valine-pyruvate aminotransferase